MSDKYSKVPNSPVGRQMVWFLENVENKGDQLDEAEVEARLAREVKARVPPKLLILGFRQIKQILGDFEVEGFDEKETPTNVEAVIVLANPAGDKFRLGMEVEFEEPNRIKGLGIMPAPDLRAEPAARSWEEFEEKFRALASRSGFLAAEIVGGEIVPIHSFDEERPLAIGSSSKVYVLGELSRQIEDGSLKWLKEIPVQERLKGLGSLLSDKYEGNSYSIQHFAEQMMQGDGTAMDHLIDLLGRERVEKAQELLGHSDPDLNTPFLTSRELLVMKTSLPAKTLQTYVSAGAADRRELLGSNVAKAKLPALTRLVEDEAPKHIDTIEWFGSNLDVVRAMLWLREAKSRPKMQALGTVLTKNPGLPFDKYAWAFTGCSAGGEAGVLSMTWLLGRHVDDRWFVMSGTLNDDRRLEAIKASPLFMAASDMLAYRRKKSKGIFGRKKK